MDRMYTHILLFLLFPLLSHFIKVTLMAFKLQHSSSELLRELLPLKALESLVLELQWWSKKSYWVKLNVNKL